MAKRASNTPKNTPKKQEYTYNEYLDTFAPQRNAEKHMQGMTRDSFMVILKRVSRPTQPQRGKGTSETSA